MEFRSREAAAFRAGLADPESAQRNVLLQQMIAPNLECEFGRRFGFKSIASVADYQKAVPISTYEGFADAIDRIVQTSETGLLTTAPTKRFFLTSGSTAKPKYIPITSALVRAKSRAFGIYWAHVFEQHPTAKSGRMVTNFSDSGEASKAPGGLPCGSESSFWASVTRATQLASKPIIPKEVAQIEDSDARYTEIARILLEETFTVIMTLNPSTILLLFQKIEQHGLAHEIWPELALGICWRSPMLQPYLDLLAPHFGPIPQRDYIMMASEGVMAIPIEDGRSGGPVAIGVHFYEFVPEDQIDQPDPDVLLPHQLELGRNYVVILTNGSGLYRYNIGDVVRVTGFVERTPCIEFLHRAGATCSLTGEKLTEDQVTSAMSETAKAMGLHIASFTVVPAKEGFPRYVALVEFEGSPGSLDAFGERFDDALANKNVEYGSKRASKRLGAPELWVVKPGEYQARRLRRLADGASDSQLKPTHLTRDSTFADQFEIEYEIGERDEG